MEHDSIAHSNESILELILKKYVQAAKDSIRGPVASKNDFRAIKTSNSNEDMSKCSKENRPLREIDGNKIRETSIDGFNMACFNVGGEKRLCFSEVVQKLLKDYNMNEIFSRRDDLLIYCSKCTPQQLDALKIAGVVPWTATSSNLISKSDTFRLWGALYGNHAPKDESKTRGPLSFEVYHECFGGCIGVLEPDLYKDVFSPSIRCTECSGMFTPKKFVSHNHTSFDEVHTCHWGFDSSRWRSYLMLVEQSPSRELLLLWDNIKAKFDPNRTKKVTSSENFKHDPEFVAYIKSPERKKATISPIESLRHDRDFKSSTSDASDNLDSRGSSLSDGKDSRQSAFHPWSPNPKSGSASTPRTTVDTPSHNRFIFPSTDSHPHARQPPPSFPGRLYQPTSKLPVVHGQCGCPGSLPAAPMYMNCQQCKHAAACSGLQLLAQKASERPVEGEIKSTEGTVGGQCPGGCELCHRSQGPDTLEITVEDVLRNYMSSEVKQPNIQDVSRVLACELKRLNLSQEEKVRDLTVANQRLQTELHVMKMEYQKKYTDALETKRRAEKELEVVQREHQKDIARFNRITWEFQHEVSKRSTVGESSSSKETVDALRKEVTLLKAQLEQSQIEQENLKKQMQLWATRSHHKIGQSFDVDWSVSSPRLLEGRQTPRSLADSHPIACRHYPDGSQTTIKHAPDTQTIIRHAAGARDRGGFDLRTEPERNNQDSRSSLFASKVKEERMENAEDYWKRSSESISSRELLGVSVLPSHDKRMNGGLHSPNKRKTEDDRESSDDSDVEIED